MRGRYARLTGRKARGKLLDEFIGITRWDRKQANKVLLGTRRQGLVVNGEPRRDRAPRPPGRSKPPAWPHWSQPCWETHDRLALALEDVLCNSLRQPSRVTKISSQEKGASCDAPFSKIKLAKLKQALQSGGGCGGMLRNQPSNQEQRCFRFLELR